MTKFATKAIHAGQKPEPKTGAVNFPIFQTTTYAQEEPGVTKGFSYSRTENPTRLALEENIAALEDAKYGVCYASGLAAINTVLNLLKAGDHIISTNDLYGGAYRLFTRLWTKFGLEFSFVDTTDTKNIENAIKKTTKLLWLETPSNPLLRITDIKKSCQIAKENNLLSVVDNTFATPLLQKPLELGADIVVHSTTKYIGGHSDVIGGAAVTNNKELYEELRFYQNAVGAVPSPHDCYLLLRGTKTLELRVKKHCENARDVASFLLENPVVEKVYFPGLKNHPNHKIAREQQKDFGGIVSFEVKGGFEAAKKVAQSLRLFVLAESLGSVRSLVNHPSSMTHASVPADVRKQNGINDNLLRLSIGIEDIDDIKHDLEQALEKVALVGAGSH